MKRVIAIAVLMMLIFNSFAYAEDYFAETKAADEIEVSLYEVIDKYTAMLTGSTLDHIAVNPNFGTYESGDYISLVYMEYSPYDPNTDEDTIIYNSTLIATAFDMEHIGIVEIAVFWDLTGYGLNGKVAFVVEDDQLKYDNVMLPKEMIK